MQTEETDVGAGTIARTKVSAAAVFSTTKASHHRQRQYRLEPLTSNVEVRLGILGEDVRDFFSIPGLREMCSFFYLYNLFEPSTLGHLTNSLYTKTLHTIVREKLHSPEDRQKFFSYLFTNMNIYTVYEQIVAILAHRHWVYVPSLAHLTKNLRQQFPAISQSLRTRNRDHSISFPKLPFVLGEETYRIDEEGEATLSVKRLHIPHPFATGFSPVFPDTDENPLEKPYRQFVQSLDGLLGCFLLQEGSIPPLENEHVHFFFLPINVLEKTRVDINDYKTKLVNKIFTANRNKISKRELEYLFNQTIQIFFPNKETLTRQEQQIFLILFYSLVELFYTSKFQLAYKHIGCTIANLQTTLNTTSMVL
ncbi:MAG: hypothetical protein K940chlam8_00722 [Chlamydiae bacterium]|nr:hypothetical protein [Chlamydiota bacterium]